MARIQILELPTIVAGDLVKTPFALVIDQVETEDTASFQDDVVRTSAEITQAEASELASRVGAVGAIVVRCTLDIV